MKRTREKDEKKTRKRREKDEKKKTWNILRERVFLEEVKDILDELKIIRIVLEEQKDISQRLFGLVAGDGVDAEPKEALKNRFVSYYQEMSGIDTSTREIAKVIEDARAIYNSVSDTESPMPYANRSRSIIS